MPARAIGDQDAAYSVDRRGELKKAQHREGWVGARRSRASHQLLHRPVRAPDAMKPRFTNPRAVRQSADRFPVVPVELERYTLSERTRSVGRSIDVLMASDLRLPGGTTASMAEEIRAQSAAGYSTGLVHISSRLVGRRDLGIEPRMRRCLDEGLADLVLPGERVHARLAVLRNATVFENVPVPELPVVADRAVLVANHVAVDAAKIRHYDPARTDDAVSRWLGVRPTWYTIGPAVRRSLSADTESIDLAGADWVNLIDVDEWAVARDGTIRGRPVIGRHSRASAAKWPERPADLLAAYPDGDDVRVRVLGGAGPVRNVIGEIPGAWIVEEFGAKDPRDFVAELDFFVYFHRSDLVEAYGRTIMEAMASGAVAILPEHFRESFGDAAVYATPQGVQPLVRRLSSDREAYLAQSRSGQRFVATTHGHAVHADRVRALIGDPSGPPTKAVRGHRGTRRPRVLFVSSNGAGMGHLTRLLAMANRASAWVEPMFFSLSQAVPVVGGFGHPWEYCPSRGDLGCTTSSWNAFFAERYTQILRRYRPQAMVFDGTMPFAGMVKVRHEFPDLLYVWCRRGMWREGTTTRWLPAGDVFDLILEPGEIAHARDRGPTADLSDAVRLAPFTLLDHTDILERDEARAELGMDPHKPALLLSLGAGNINDITSDIEVFSDAASELPGSWQVHATRPPIARSGTQARDHVRPLSVHPLMQYLRAFDAAVVAPGYNSFHEVVMASVPTAFVPNDATITDDQAGRAEFAQTRGFGLAVPDVTPVTAAAALHRLADPTESEAMRGAAAALRVQNGAGPAMRLVEQALADRGVRV